MGQSAKKKVSIVIPVHNAMPELEKALSSVVRQTYPLENIEAIVIDDASTDGSWEVIAEYAKQYPGTFVCERFSNASGSPAKPRNYGIDIAQGDYVLFLDADDQLGTEAIEKAVQYAEEWDSDILYLRVVSDTGRTVPKSMFVGNRAQVDPARSNIYWSLSIFKLFRRSLINKSNARFFEDGMPEDLHLVVAAIKNAKVISIADDYDYYHWNWRAGEANTIHSVWSNFEANMRSYTALVDYIEAQDYSADEKSALLRRLLKVDVVNMINEASKQAFDEYQERVACLKALFGSYFTSELASSLDYETRTVLSCALQGSEDAAYHVLNAGTPLMEYGEIETNNEGVWLKVATDIPAVKLEDSLWDYRRKQVKRFLASTKLWSALKRTRPFLSVQG